MNPFYSSRISDCRGLDDVPQSIDTSKRCLDDRTLRNDTSYLMNTNMQNNLTQNINVNNRTYQDNSHNGTFFIQNQNGILDDRMISFVNCSFNRPSKKVNNEGDEEDPEQPETPPQNQRQREFFNGDILVQQQKEEEEDEEEASSEGYEEQNESNQIDNGEMNMRQGLNPPFNLQQNADNSAIEQQDKENQQQQLQSHNAGLQMIRQNIRSQAEENVLRQQQLQQQRIRFMIQQRQNNQQASSRNQLPPQSLRQLFQGQQFQSPQSNQAYLQQWQQQSNQNEISLQRQQLNPSSRVSSGPLNERRRNQQRQSGNSTQNNYLDSFNSYLQSINFMGLNSQQYQNYQQSRQQQKNSSRARDDQSEANSAHQNEIENVDHLEQQRQVEQLSQIIRNSRRRMNENRRANQSNQIQVGGRVQQVVEIDEEDKLRAKLIFKKALTHLIILTVFSVFLISVFYIHLLMEGLWLILFFIFCFFTGNKLSFYKSLPEDVTYEEKRQAFFDVVEFVFINVLIFMIFLFFKLINQPITLLFVYTPFVHIIWWLVFTTKTQESMNRHIELLLRIYAVTQSILFAVQYDTIVNWSWVSIFLPSWILLSSLGFYIFGLTVLFFCSLYYCIIGQTDKYQRLVWCLMVSIHIVGGSLFFLLALIEYFDTNDLQLLRYSCGMLIAGSAFSTIFTVACSQDLEIFIALANSENLFNGAHQVQVERRNPLLNGQENNAENNNNNEQNQNEDNQANFLNQIANFSQANRGQDELQPKKIKIIRTTKTIPRTIPQFLIRFSSTYFQQSDVNRELIVLLQKKNMEILKKKKLEQKEQVGQSKSSPKSNSGKKISLTQLKMGKKSSSNNNDLEESKQSKQEGRASITKGQRQSIKEEKITNRSVQDSKLSSQPSCQQCLVCFDNQPDSVILECGHGGLCNSCALDIWKKTGECYLCRQTITKIVQIDVDQKLGKYKQIIAISNMHEVSHDQEEERNQNNRSEFVLQQQPQPQQIVQQQINNNPQNREQPFEEQLNYEIQHANEQNPQQPQHQNQQQSQNDLQQELPQQQEQQQEEQQQQQQQGLQQPQPQEVQQQQEQQIENIQEKVNDEYSEIKIEMKQPQEQQNEEDITIIQIDDEDEMKKESDERQQYQESTVMKVTLSQYTNMHNDQIQISSMNISDFENQQIQPMNDQQINKQDRNANSKSQQTLSIENIEKQILQIEEMDSAENADNSISKYQCELENTIKKPETKSAKGYSSHQQQESSVFQSPTHQKFIFDEQHNIDSSNAKSNLQCQPLGIINQNVAQPLPVSPNLKKISSNEKHINYRNIYFSEQKETDKGGPSLKINQFSQSDSKLTQFQESKKGSNKNINPQEWDIEETQQSTSRSQQLAQNLQSTRNTIQVPNNAQEIPFPSYQSQDTQKIQTLDKYMSKYFDSTNYEDPNSELGKEPSIFNVNKNKINQQKINENNFNSSQPQINKQSEEIIQFSDYDKENGIKSLDDISPPPIQRLGVLKYKLNNSNNQIQNQEYKGEDILVQKDNAKSDQKEINLQLSSLRVDQENELINFDDSEEQTSYV